MTEGQRQRSVATQGEYDSTSRQEFYDYYARESESTDTRRRFVGIRDTVLRVRERRGGKDATVPPLQVVDIGCGAGTQSMIWAGMGHRVHGIDINAPLIELAHDRARRAGLEIDYRVGSATALPWADRSMDVCLVPELLEHVPEWQQCVDECVRILRPGGVLFISTNNKLCPVQHEFNLPLYSWYPARLKRHYEQLARTTRPQLANYATYPAVNWFTYRRLASQLRQRMMDTFDRFDVIKDEGLPTAKRLLVWSVRYVPLLRFMGQALTPYTLIVAIKR